MNQCLVLLLFNYSIKLLEMLPQIVESFTHAYANKMKPYLLIEIDDPNASDHKSLIVNQFKSLFKYFLNDIMLGKRQCFSLSLCVFGCTQLKIDAALIHRSQCMQ